MRKRITSLAIAVAGLAVTPAHGRDPLPGEQTAFGPSFVPPAGPGTAPRSQTEGLFGAGSGLGVAARNFTEEDGSRSSRRGLIANWAVTGGIDAGVGLFSVTGNGKKHNEFKRSWTVKEVTPRSENIAAVGMKLKF